MDKRKGEQTDLSVLLQNLIGYYNQMLGIVKNIDGVAKQTKMLSFNSSIEAARVGEAGRGFAVIAKEIQDMAFKSEVANKNSLVTINEMNQKIYDVVGVRTADITYELNDKIERNFYERYCDIQVWSSFPVLLQCLEHPIEENVTKACELLSRIIDVYQVYYDIYMADLEGNIIAVGKHLDATKVNVSERKWYKGVKEAKTVTASDLYYSDSIHGHTIAYSCPIRDKSNNIVGYLSTRYDWEYVSEIIKSAKISSKGEIYLLNKEGTVIASRDKSDILKKDMAKTDVFCCLQKGEEFGYYIEEDDKGGLTSAIGYSKSKGYGNYSGKGWSIVIREPF